MRSISDACAEILGPVCRPVQNIRIYLPRSKLPRRRDLIELRERVEILAEYYGWDMTQTEDAWHSATKLQRSGLHIGAIMAEIDK